MKRADDFVIWEGGGSLHLAGANKGRYKSAPMRQLFIDLLSDDQQEVMMSEHLLQELTNHVRLVTQLDQVYITDEELKDVVAKQMLKLCKEVVDYVVQKQHVRLYPQGRMVMCEKDIRKCTESLRGDG